jgi:hypothetical protein
MKKPRLLTASSILAFVFIFSMTGLDIVLSYLGWKPTFGDDLLAGIIGFLPSVGSVSLSMLIGITPSWRTKILASVIWLFCITISLTGNFLNMTARAFDSLDTENIAKVEVVNVKDTNQSQMGILKDVNQSQLNVFKDANKAELELFDQEIADLNDQLREAREARDLQINDGVNRDGSIGPKARAFQAAMDRISIDIEKKRVQKRELQAESTTALLKFQSDAAKEVLRLQSEASNTLSEATVDEASNTLSEATVDLAETQNDMKGHMPVIRYFLPNKEHQRQVVLWGLGLFAAVISLAGPVVSYAMAVHLNHKRTFVDDTKKLKKKIEPKVEIVEEPVQVVVEEPVQVVVEEPKVEIVEEPVQVVVEEPAVDQPEKIKKEVPPDTEVRMAWVKGKIR